MTKLDEMIEEALTAEDREIFEATKEQGWFALSLSQFRGKLGWITWVIMIVQTSMFVAAVWTAFRFYGATDTLMAVKWGVTSATLVLMATVLKVGLMPQIQADRVLRELHRLELLIVRRDTGK